jgi:hypothetical protein
MSEAISEDEPDVESSSETPDSRPKADLDKDSPPISNIRDMFEDMVKQDKFVALRGQPVKLKVATLCSGTDAPIFALRMIQDAMQVAGFGMALEFDHLFSCEIEPEKQGFIRRNLGADTLIFRDVFELATSDGQA